MLIKLSIEKFLEELASSSPAPGGGSVAALCGATGCALTEMVCNLTIGKRKYAEVEEEVKKIRSLAQDLRMKYLEFMEQDTEAFNRVMKAIKLPKESEDQKQIRLRSIEEATRVATQIPFEVVSLSMTSLNLAVRMAEIGNTNSLSDIAGAVLCIRFAAEEAANNIFINLSAITDPQLVQKYRSETGEMITRITALAEKISKQVKEKIEG